MSQPSFNSSQLHSTGPARATVKTPRRTQAPQLTPPRPVLLTEDEHVRFGLAPPPRARVSGALPATDVLLTQEDLVAQLAALAAAIQALDAKLSRPWWARWTR